MKTQARRNEGVEALTLREFIGLDLRQLPEETSPEALLACSNISVSAGHGYETRDPLRRFATLDSESVGLYSVGDKLRAALPYPDPADRAVPRPPPGFTYDALIDSVSGFAGTLQGVASVTPWENTPYLCVVTPTPSGIRYRHYYVGTPVNGVGIITAQASDVLTISGLPATVTVGSTMWALGDVGAYVITAIAGDQITVSPTPPTLVTPAAATFIVPTRNRVDLPFEPGPAVATAAEKVFAVDRFGKFAWFSSTEFGPTNWDATDDAGALPTSRQAGGDHPASGLAIFNDKLVVFYARSAQFWAVDPFPDNMELVSVVGGAGTEHPGSIANVQGDLFYLGDGLFRSLAAVITTGQPKDSDQLGSRIAKLTRALDPTLDPRAVWSARRQQYLCAVGSQIFAFTWTQGENGATGWGRWDLPFAVSHLVEHSDGKLYVRRADAPEVYVFDPDTDDEEVEFSARLGAVDCGNPGTFKRFVFMDAVMTGTAEFAVGTNVEDLDDETVIATIDGSTSARLRVPMLLTADRMFPRFSGTGPWMLDALTLRYRQGALS